VVIASDILIAVELPLTVRNGDGVRVRHLVLTSTELIVARFPARGGTSTALHFLGGFSLDAP
jgi:hypothetical protein